MTHHDDDETPLSAEPAPLDPRTARLLAGAAAPRPLPAAFARGCWPCRPAPKTKTSRGGASSGRAPPPWPPPVGSCPCWRPARRNAPNGRSPAGSPRRGGRGGLPAALRERLVGLGRAARRPLPFWLVDLRYATAACLLLTLLSTLVAEDASALLGQKAAAADARRQELQAELGEAAAQGGEGALAAFRRGYRGGQRILLSRAEAVRDLFEEKLRQFNQTELGRRLAGERATRGVQNGK